MVDRAVWTCSACAMGPCVLTTDPAMELHYFCMKDGAQRAYWARIEGMEAKL